MLDKAALWSDPKGTAAVPFAWERLRGTPRAELIPMVAAGKAEAPRQLFLRASGAKGIWSSTNASVSSTLKKLLGPHMLSGGAGQPPPPNCRHLSFLKCHCRPRQHQNELPPTAFYPTQDHCLDL